MMKLVTSVCAAVLLGVLYVRAETVNYATTLPPLYALGALKIADKVTVAMEAVGEKIRLNSQGWEDA
jgi:hypothetical protein